MKKGVPAFQIFCYALAVALLFIYLFPLFFSFNTSIKTSREYLLNPIGLTQSWTFENYSTAWFRAKFGDYILNSVLYTSVCTTVSIVMSVFIAFPIARRLIPASRFWFNLFLCGLFLPSGAIPLFQIILKMGLHNTKLGYMLIMTGVSSTSVYFFSGYFRAIPKDMDEAALIEGCGYLRYVFSVLVPLSKPAIASMGVLSMIGVWNDIVSSTIYLTSENNFNITRGLTVFTGQYSSDWTLTAAGLFIVAAPLILIYIFCQRYIVDGVMAGGIKG